MARAPATVTGIQAQVGLFVRDTLGKFRPAKWWLFPLNLVGRSD